MMKTILFFFLAVAAVASAGLVGSGPEVYSAVSTKQVHHPWATSSSSRVQHFNHQTLLAQVNDVVPVATVTTHVGPVTAHVTPVVAYDLGQGHGHDYDLVSGLEYSSGFGAAHGWDK